MDIKDLVLSEFKVLKRDYIPKCYKQTKTENLMTNKEWWKNYYAGLNLIFGVTCILCAFYFFAPTLFTFKNSLVPIDGKLQKVETYYVKVNNRGKFGHKFTSNKYELIL